MTTRKLATPVGSRGGKLATQRKTKSSLVQPITLSGLTAVTADWHLPLTDFDYLDTFIEHARAREIKQLVIAGDLLHADALSRFDPKQSDAGLEVELAAANETMAHVLDQFESVALLQGNHDARLVRALGYKLPFATAMKMALYELPPEQLGRLTISPLDHLWITNGLRGKKARSFYVAHPTTYSRTPLGGAIKLAAKVGASTLVGHSHHLATGYATNGKHLVAELGGFHAPAKTEYLQTASTFPYHVNGYAFVTAAGGLEVYGRDSAVTLHPAA